MPIRDSVYLDNLIDMFRVEQSIESRYLDTKLSKVLYLEI